MFSSWLILSRDIFTAIHEIVNLIKFYKADVNIYLFYTYISTRITYCKWCGAINYIVITIDLSKYSVNNTPSRPRKPKAQNNEKRHKLIVEFMSKIANHWKLRLFMLVIRFCWCSVVVAGWFAFEKLNLVCIF